MSRPAAVSKAQESVAPPASATHAAVAWIGVISMLGACALLNFWSPFRQYSPVEQIAYEALFVMACTALAIFIPDLLWQKVQRRTLTSTLNAVDLANRKVAWTFATEASKRNGPTYTKPDGSPNYEAAFDSDFYDDMMAGYSRMMMVGPILSSPVVVDSVVYFGGTDGNLYALM